LTKATPSRNRREARAEERVSADANTNGDLRGLVSWIGIIADGKRA
jgi:hypothetical protein